MQTVSYILFSIYILLYAIFSLTIIKLQTNPIIHRVTFYNTPVRWTITGSLQYDIIISSILFSAAVLLTFKKSISLPLAFGTILGTVVVSILGMSYLQIENVVFILTFPSLIVLLIVHKILSKIKPKKMKFWFSDVSNFKFQKFLTVFFLVVGILEVLAFTRWAVNPFLLGITSTWTWQLNLLENNLFYAFGLISVYLMLFSIISFVLKSYLTKFAKWVDSNIVQNNDRPENYDDVDDLISHGKYNSQLKRWIIAIRCKSSSILKSESRTLLIICLFAVVPSSLLSLYPYAVDSTHAQFLGTDAPEYLKTLDVINKSLSNPSSFLYQTFIHQWGGSRPFSLLIMYSLSFIPNQTEYVILKNLPVVLGPFLVISVYYLTRTSYPEKRALAVIAAIMTAASHQLVIGFYAAYYANWIALITMNISIMFLLKSIQIPTRKNLALFGVLTTLTLFFHSYVWSYYIAVVALFLTWSAVQKKMQKESLRTLLVLGVITLGIIAIDAAESHAGGAGESFAKDLSNPDVAVGLSQFAEKWQNLNTTFVVYLGGFLTNSAVLLLVFLWTLKANYQNDSDRFYLSMLFVSLLPMLFGDFVVQSRILYNIPLQIPASVMMYKIYSNPKVMFGKPLLIALILMQFNYALRAMANMYFVAPTQ